MGYRSGFLHAFPSLWLGFDDPSNTPLAKYVSACESIDHLSIFETTTYANFATLTYPIGEVMNDKQILHTANSFK